MNYPILFVSLGPGDPELITLKGLKILRSADKIYCPATRGTDKIISRAMELLNALEIDSSTVFPFYLPMSKKRSGAIMAYDKLFNLVQMEYQAGKKIVIAVEGDAGFYSSIQYVYDRCLEKNIPVERIAGIPAFIATGALTGIHVFQQDERMLVVPGTATVSELSDWIEQGRVIVIMKLSRCAEAIHMCVCRFADEMEFHYFENVGTSHELYTNRPSDIIEKEFPYFSLLIIRPKEH